MQGVCKGVLKLCKCSMNLCKGGVCSDMWSDARTCVILLLSAPYCSAEDQPDTCLSWNQVLASQEVGDEDDYLHNILNQAVLGEIILKL